MRDGSRQSRDEVISAIYACAVEPDALARIAYALRSYLDVDSAGLWLLDQGEITDITQTADIVESIGPYLGHYRTIDPWSAARKTPGEVYLGSDSVDEDQLVRTEFYRDFARHYGMLRPMGLTLALEPGLVATVALNRTSTRRLLGECERTVLQGLSIHLRGALMLHKRLLADCETATAQGAALDALTFGMMTCDADARIRTMNRAAAELEAAGAFALGRSDRSLCASTLQETRALRTLIRAAAQGQPGAMRVRAVAGPALSILVTPTEHDGARYALVCLHRDDAAPSLDAALLSRLFGLSPAQSELCILLLAGRTFEAAAAERGIATSTARSYFLAILDRTGTKNLRDLLRLLGALPQVR